MNAALGTYAAALITIAASLGIGGGILAACGRREWSWTAPAVGLAAATIVAWWSVRLPGHGTTALVVLGVLTAAGSVLTATRLSGLGDAAKRGAPLAVAVLLATSIPFAVAGNPGVLGTGFNVDMSQHLFAASWLADPTGKAPGLFTQGYPLGPHAIAVATNEITGNLIASFSGVTMAVPVIVALTALAGLDRWPVWRAWIAAGLTGIAYLVATYFAQGAFKELFEIALLIGFALWLAELRREGEGARFAVGVPGAILVAATLYVYSSPGLAWLGGTLVLWAVAELARRRGEAGARLRSAAPAVGVAVLLALVLVAPEIDRISDFGGSVGTVSDSGRADLAPRTALFAQANTNDNSIDVREPAKPEKLDFDDDLGNLFGQISPLEALGVWPSGDFRVAPGDGGVPAPVFYLGALLGALALAIGITAAVRAGETALLAALAAAFAIWLAARIGSTPYTAAKALAILGAVVMLVSARGLLRPATTEGRPLLPGPLQALVAAAFVLAAGASSALALGNAPVGPDEYHPGARELTNRFEGRPTLVIIPAAELTDQLGSEFYGWEFREATPPCVTTYDSGDPANGGWRRVAVVGGDGQAPWPGLKLIDEAGGVAIYSVPRPAGGFPPPRTSACG